MSARTNAVAALPEDAALGVGDGDADVSARSDMKSGNTAQQDLQGSVQLAHATGAQHEPDSSLNNRKSSGGLKVQEAKEVFENFADGKPFLHKAALSEVLKNAYRSAHNSSSRQAEAAVDQLLGQMKIDTAALPPAPPPKDEDQLLAEEEGRIDEEGQDPQEEWLRHVYDPEHITFEEFCQGWDSWKEQ